MLKNLKDSKSQDTSQISQPEELKNSHINNILMLYKRNWNS